MKTERAQRAAAAQDAAKVTGVLKQSLAVAGANQVNVRHYDVPPGWISGKHHHSGHMFLYIVEGSGAMDTEGEVRTAGADQVIQQMPHKSMVMRNASTTERLKFVLFQVGAEGEPLIVPEK